MKGKLILLCSCGLGSIQRYFWYLVSVRNRQASELLSSFADVTHALLKDLRLNQGLLFFFDNAFTKQKPDRFFSKFQTSALPKYAFPSPFNCKLFCVGSWEVPLNTYSCSETAMHYFPFVTHFSFNPCTSLHL